MRVVGLLLLWLCASVISASETIWLDVRTAEEYAAEHVESAHNIPFDQIEQRISEVSGDTSAEIILYCRSGRRAELATNTLNQLGYTNVTNLRTLSAAQSHFKERSTTEK